MKTKFGSLFCFTAVVLTFFVSLSAEANTFPADETLPVQHLIQKGGYTLYIRHGEATIGQDRPDISFMDCTTQRNLSDDGRRQARAVGDFLRKNNIPIEYPVGASPYCRTMETAAIAVGKENVIPVPVLAKAVRLNDAATPAEERRQIISDITRLLEAMPVAGSSLTQTSSPTNIHRCIRRPRSWHFS
ncbi:histidine phosphatase family protein [Paenibacillus beijingensis]|uniref:histidine phosphatase family protein n=1 Tax=Paenibacillus beijingensis TaxID=1126833 RepID=UPI0009E2619E